MGATNTGAGNTVLMKSKPLKGEFKLKQFYITLKEFGLDINQVREKIKTMMSSEMDSQGLPYSRLVVKIKQADAERYLVKIRVIKK